MNSGSSAFIGSGWHCEATSCTASCSQTSRPLVQATSPPVFFTTITDLTMSPTFSSAASTLGLQRRLATAAHALVRRDDDGRGRALDAAGERLRGEAAEHDRMHRADPRAGEHRIGRLGDHRQIDRDPVALLDAVMFEYVGEPADVFGEFGVGDVFRLRGIVAFPDDRGLVGRASADAGRCNCRRRW